MKAKSRIAIFFGGTFKRPGVSRRKQFDEETIKAEEKGLKVLGRILQANSLIWLESSRKTDRKKYPFDCKKKKKRKTEEIFVENF